MLHQRIDKMPQARHPRGPPTPSMSTPAADYDQQLTGSPPPPPTPAASPGPAHCQPDWSDAAADEDFFLAKIRSHFKNCSDPQRTRVLADLLNLCTSQQLSFVHQFVSPLLKKDPFTTLPNELCLRVSVFAPFCRPTPLSPATRRRCLPLLIQLLHPDPVLHRRSQSSGPGIPSIKEVARPPKR
jgi:F-box and WD-40 domain protein CDC4